MFIVNLLQQIFIRKLQFRWMLKYLVLSLPIYKINITTPLSEPERHLLNVDSTKANAFYELGRKKIGKNEPCSPQKAFAFVEYGTRSCLSDSDRGVEAFMFTGKVTNFRTQD